MSGGSGQEHEDHQVVRARTEADGSDHRQQESPLSWFLADVLGEEDDDGHREVVATESEVDTRARLVVLSHDGIGQNWTHEAVVTKSEDRRALHTLEITDLDGDGRNDIFTAEMENGKTDGQHTIPEWFMLSLTEDGWTEEVLFDGNLGAHEGKVADFDDDGDLEIVGKIWHPNLPNGNGTNHHVSCLDPVAPEE